jgi:hypothetical protein
MDDPPPNEPMAASVPWLLAPLLDARLVSDGPRSASRFRPKLPPACRSVTGNHSHHSPHREICEQRNYPDGIAGRDQASAPAPVTASRRSTGVVIGVLIVGATGAFAAWEGLQTRSSAPAHWSVAAAITLVLMLAVIAGRARQRQRSGDWLAASAAAVRAGPTTRAAYGPGVAVWVLLIGALVAWDLVSFLTQSHQLPTLSYFAGKVTDHQAGRALVFWGWLLLGIALAIGQLASRRRAGSGR